MTVEEAKDILKKCNSGELYFAPPKRYETIAECIETVLSELDSKDKEIEELKDNRKFMEENIEDIKLVLLLYKQNKTLIKGTFEAFIKGYAQASEDTTETLKQHFENLAKEEK
jgi:hypothetical protein